MRLRRKESTIKVAFVYMGTDVTRVGGIQKLTFEICKKLIKRGGKAVVITRYSGEGKERYKFSGKGAKFYRLPWPRKSKGPVFTAIRLMINLLRIVNILQREDIEIVHFMGPLKIYYYFPLLLLRKVLGFKAKIIIYIGATLAEHLSDMEKKIIGTYSDAIIAPSKYNKKIFGYFQNKIFVTYPGHDLEVSQVHEKNDIVLAVGRVDRRKNYETLIKTANELKEWGEKVKFHVVGPVGDANYIKKLRRLVRRHDLEENVSFLGYVSEEKLNELYKKSKIFYLPTKHEMFGIVFAEAMSQGLPIVSSNTSAIPEVVGDAGILLDTWDYRAHAKTIACLLNDKTLYESLSQQAVERAKKFTWDNTFKQFISIWGGLTKK